MTSIPVLAARTAADPAVFGEVPFTTVRRTTLPRRSAGRPETPSRTAEAAGGVAALGTPDSA